MIFLKKASHIEIEGGGENAQYRESAAKSFKAFELYLSLEHLAELLNKNSNSFNNMMNALKLNNAAIYAIHCPESSFTVTADCNEKRENYLSVCEAINDAHSFSILMNVLKLADEISKSMKQRIEPTSSQNNDKTDDDEDDEINTNENGGVMPRSDDKGIIVIIHDGCPIGCSIGQTFECVKDSKRVKQFADELSELNLSTGITIAVENITPYIDPNGNLRTGENCGWNLSAHSENYNIELVKQLNSHIVKNKNGIIRFGLCIDFCHIFACRAICSNKSTDEDYIDEMNTFFNALDKNRNLVAIFHASYLGANKTHGMMFPDDGRIIAEIRKWLKKYDETNNRNYPVTLELDGGQYTIEASDRFYRTVLEFSKLHTSGNLGTLLESDECSDLREYFDALYTIYSSPLASRSAISKAVYKAKKFILGNAVEDYAHRGVAGEQSSHTIPFGFTHGSEKYSTPLLRLKAYLEYTRSCLMGEYLAKNYYNSDSVISKEYINGDFALAMKYLMINDSIGLVEHNGVSFTINADLFPHTEFCIRMNDGIPDDNEDKFYAFAETSEISNIKAPFSRLMEIVKYHINGKQCYINGCWLQYPLYSCGKFLGACMWKYYNPNAKWSLCYYGSAVPINYIEVTKDERVRRYSIPAFLQRYSNFNNGLFINDSEEYISDFAINICTFKNNRGDQNSRACADSLIGLFKALSPDITTEQLKEKTDSGQNSTGISLTTVGSISDGEIVFLKQPERRNGCKILLTEEFMPYFFASFERYKGKNKQDKPRSCDTARDLLEAVIRDYPVAGLLNEHARSFCDTNGFCYYWQLSQGKYLYLKQSPDELDKLVARSEEMLNKLMEEQHEYCNS